MVCGRLVGGFKETRYKRLFYYSKGDQNGTNYNLVIPDVYHQLEFFFTCHQFQTWFLQIKGLTTWNFPTDFKSEYWHRNKNRKKSHKNVLKHVQFKWFNYDHGNSSDLIRTLHQQLFVKLAVEERKAHELSFNYTDRSTGRSNQLLNIYSKVKNKKPRGKLQTYFVLKNFRNV